LNGPVTVGSPAPAQRNESSHAMSNRIVFVNGEYVNERDAKISVLDHAVLYGDGVFETALAWDGRVYKLHAHVDRLYRSMKAIALDPPYSKPEMVEILLETVRRNALQNAYIKVLVTRGPNGEPLMDTTDCIPGVIAFARPYLYMASPDRIANGLTVKTASVRRPSAQVLDPHIKSLNYLNLVMAKLEAKAAGADEALLLDLRGHVCEAPGYNVFIVNGSTLRTPWEDILEGITRETVIEMATAADLNVQETTVELYDVYTADEFFFCSTAGGLLPVVSVDGRAIGTGVPGPVYRQLHAAYEGVLASGVDTTPVYPSPTHVATASLMGDWYRSGTGD
jgi:branched-chain amino acid aminotransferase